MDYLLICRTPGNPINPIVQLLNTGNYGEVSFFLEMGLFQYNEIVAASIFTGHDVSMLVKMNSDFLDTRTTYVFQIYPEVRFIEDVNIQIIKPFMIVVHSVMMQIQWLDLLTEKETIAFGSFIHSNDAELYFKMQEAFLIDESSVHFFSTLPHNLLTGDQGLLLAEFCDCELLEKFRYRDDNIYSVGLHLWLLLFA